MRAFMVFGDVCGSSLSAAAIKSGHRKTLLPIAAIGRKIDSSASVGATVVGPLGHGSSPIETGMLTEAKKMVKMSTCNAPFPVHYGGNRVRRRA